MSTEFEVVHGLSLAALGKITRLDYEVSLSTNTEYGL